MPESFYEKSYPEFIHLRDRFPRGSFDEVIEHIADAMCHISEYGCINLASYSFETSYKHSECVSTLLLCALNLITYGAADECFFSTLEYEFLRLIRFSAELTELELARLSVMKQSVIYLRCLDVDKFHTYTNYFRSPDICMPEKYKEIFGFN